MIAPVPLKLKGEENRVEHHQYVNGNGNPGHVSADALKVKWSTSAKV